MTPPETPSTPLEPARTGERIAKLLARAGVASRREIERMIAEGRVKLNGEVLTTPATVLPNLRGVTVDDAPVAAAERTRLFAFHKPPGMITAERDFSGRPTIYNALINALPPGTPRLMPVGRLDFNTEGLLLLTNDGEFKRALELPSSKVPRTYRARAFGAISQAQLEELAEGITIDEMRYGKIIADMERRTGRNGWVVLTLSEGKNREVRRVLEHLGLEVSRLIRTAYGPFHLGELARGAAVELLEKDVDRFRAQLGLGPAEGAQPRRGPVAVAKPQATRPVRGNPIASKPTTAKPAPRRRVADSAAIDRAAFDTAPSPRGKSRAAGAGAKPAKDAATKRPYAQTATSASAAGERDDKPRRNSAGNSRAAPRSGPGTEGRSGPRSGPKPGGPRSGPRTSPRSGPRSGPAKGGR